MNRELIDEVIECLPKERTLFHYFKGEYAFKLLSFAAEKRKTVNAIKQSPYQRLLKKPDIQTVLSSDGSGNLTPDMFRNTWKESSETFVLTLDRWCDKNRWSNQLTRHGGNLVLQLNFSEKHNRAYQKLLKPEDEFVFNYSGHPVMAQGERKMFRNTLAWSRLDIDLESGEVLIEEVQSDWVRKIKACARIIKMGKKPRLLRYCDCDTKHFISYVEDVFSPFFDLWSEAMLMATVNFIYTELGIGNIYYHTYETGTEIKRVEGKPPRSLYSDLPRQFCFEKTDEDPVFLQKDRSFNRVRRKLNNIHWYKLEL